MSVTYVYTITSSDDTLYVGHTSNLFQRLRQHSREPWAQRVRKVRAEVFASKDEATRYERNLIADLEPEFNIQGNPRHESWDQYLAHLTGSPQPTQSPPPQSSARRGGCRLAAAGGRCRLGKTAPTPTQTSTREQRPATDSVPVPLTSEIRKVTR